jgi:hypothetical protein
LRKSSIVNSNFEDQNFFPNHQNIYGKSNNGLFCFRTPPFSYEKEDFSKVYDINPGENSKK